MLARDHPRLAKCCILTHPCNVPACPRPPSPYLPPSCEQDDERFNLSAQEYLERYHIQVYVNDCIRTILDTREDRPLETALKYFNSVLQVCEGYSKGRP